MDPLATLGSKAPDFELVDLDGITRRLIDMRGHILLLNFWSAACPWSERVDKQLILLLDSIKEEISLWSIASNVDETLDTIQSVASQRSLPIVLPDPGHKVADLYDAVTTPQFFLIDQDGILRYQGAFDDATFREREASEEYLKNALDAIQKDRLPNPQETMPYGCALVRYVA